LAAVVGAILFAAVKLGGSQSTVSVPNEVLKPVSVAQQDLENAHLRPTIQNVADATHPVDTVVRQDPVGGKSVSRGSTVTLYVSSGAAQKQIPYDITTGRSAADVTKELTGLGFIVVPKSEANGAPKGTVFDSSPKPGTNALVGSTVTILVSSGPAPATVPPVSGLTYEQATTQLEQAGFTNLNPPIQTASATVPAGSVIRTDPAGGKAVALSTPINIYVSSGAQQVTVPPEIGQTEAAASAALTAKGFTVSTLNQVDDANVGKVVAQTPAGGTLAAPDSNVVLTIGIASTPASTTTTVPPTTTTT
jgi:serine/threonine-protein kinase